MNAATVKNIAMFLLLCLGAAAYSQSAVRLRGRIVDAANGQPLPGANVQVIGTGAGAASGASGRFEIENLLNGDYTLRISYMGYETVERRVFVRDDEPATLLIRLQPVVLPLPGVQVAAARDDGQRSDGVIVLTRERIARTQTDDLGSLLKSVGGVQIVEADGKKTIQIRGARANQTLVLLDGVKLNDPVTGEVDLSQTPLHNVQKIEIKKGSAAEYGDGALGGVIRIFTLNGGEDQQSLSWQSGSYGVQNAAASINRTWQPFAFIASAQSSSDPRRYPYRYADANAAPRTDVRRNADVNSLNVFFRGAFQTGAHSADLKLSAFNSDRGTPGKIFYWTPYARVSSGRTSLLGSYGFSGGHWKLSANGGRTWQETENRNLRPAAGDLPFGSTPEFHFRNRLIVDHLNGRAHFEWTEHVSLVAGIDGQRLSFSDNNVLTPSATAVGRAEDKSVGFYLKPEISVRRRDVYFSAAPVLRLDAAELSSDSGARAERQLSPGLRLFLSHGARRQVYVRAEVNRAFRMPTFADLFYQDFRVQGKPDLAPEKSRNLEAAVGVNWSGPLNIHADAAFFSNHIKDMIVWRLGSFEFFRPYNTDALLRGGEYSLQISSPSDRIGLDLFYSHLKALNKSDNVTLHDKMLPYRPEHSYTISARISGAKWTVNVGWRGAGRRFITEANTKAMPSYAVVDVSAEWTLRLTWVDLQWRAAVLNVLDEHYEILRDMPLPGREWRLGLTLKSR